MVDTSGPSSPFTASRGWFHHFKVRSNLYHDTAKAFPAELASLTEEKWYPPEQVFNADENDLFWKKMLTRTFISQRKSKAAGWLQGCKGPGIPSLLKCRRGLLGKAHDALPFPERTCAEVQKQAGIAFVLEGEQEGMVDVRSSYGTSS